MFCDDCGYEAKNKAGLAAHRRAKHPVAPVQDDEQPRPMVSVGAPAVIPDVNVRVSPIKVTVVSREIKMLRPICATCQRAGRAPQDWWMTCPHDKYVQVVPVRVTEPRYEAELDAAGNPTGRQQLMGMDEFVKWEERPNWVQISHKRSINSFALVSRKRRARGFIFPHELRSKSFPYGVADPCEYRDCFVQENLKEYRWGRFCRVIEAQLVGFDHRMSEGGGALEIGDSQQSLEKQRRQLESVPL